MNLLLSMRALAVVSILFGAGGSLRAAEHVTLRNGFELDCERREAVGERVRIYLVPQVAAAGDGTGANYFEVAADAIVRVEAVERTPVAIGNLTVEKRVPSTGSGQALRSAQDDKGKGGRPSAPKMREMLAHAGGQHRVDADLLASVVRAESGGQVAAVSRVGARGLMQLMPATALAMGVKDAFVAEQNIDGGSAYLDWLLTRYHDDMALALAAYNAGPAAIDRWHGIPPYRETRAYVARVIREFNRLKLAER